MNITKKTYQEICTFFQKRHVTEEGGLLGSSTGKVIDCFFPDYQASIKTKNSYTPNIFYLNQQLQEWEKNEITFCGIIHSHLTNTPKLSDADIRYIEKIMKAMPNSIKQLYFPLIVQPKTQFISYKAVRNLWNKVNIQSDSIKII